MIWTLIYLRPSMAGWSGVLVKGYIGLSFSGLVDEIFGIENNWFTVVAFILLIVYVIRKKKLLQRGNRRSIP